MLKKFISYIETNNLLKKGKKTLLSVSGGKDSMVMASLFRMTNYPHAIAHINHNTRGADNQKEEDLIRLYCEENEIKFYRTDIDPDFLLKSNFQARARDFRYAWLQDIALNDGYDKIATGHHLKDNVESFFINLFRSAGIKGLSGIAPSKGNIITP